jgi:DNA-binding CsgD family transcriptional regulator
MRTAESKSVSEIAAELSISPKTVETQIARAKSFLRQHVSKLLFVAFFINLGL